MRNDNIELGIASKPLSHLSRAQRIDRVKTVSILKDLLTGGDVAKLSSIKIDQLEAARFIQKQAKILRFVSISAEMPTLTFLVEEIYYTAFDDALLRLRPDYRKFRELLIAGSDLHQAETKKIKA
jgi:Asp-tRNA(Asn)/Glu-tRNA(Gln) amidotransferase C subunit